MYLLFFGMRGALSYTAHLQQVLCQEFLQRGRCTNRSRPTSSVSTCGNVSIHRPVKKTWAHRNSLKTSALTWRLCCATSSRLILECLVALNNKGFTIGAAVMHLNLKVGSQLVPGYIYSIPRLQLYVFVSCRCALEKRSATSKSHQHRKPINFVPCWRAETPNHNMLGWANSETRGGRRSSPPQV